MAILLCVTVSSRTEPLPRAFFPGEKLTFELRWELIPAGKAVLEVMPFDTADGVQRYHFVLTAKSNSFVDFFYKVRDRIDAYADIDMTHSLRYLKKQHEGSHKRDEVVEFDWQQMTTRYSNFGKFEKSAVLSPGTFDPLSAFYFTRILDLVENTVITRPVTDGKKVVIGRAKIIRRETLELKAGTFDTLLIEPEIKKIGGVFKESKNARIHVWVTADSRHIPLLVKSRVVVGRFIGELISIEPAR